MPGAEMEISEYDYKITNTNENFESDLVSLANMILILRKNNVYN